LSAPGTVLWSTPLAALWQFINIGQPVPLGGGTTSQGLAITAIPANCAISIDFG
jgi:hypothetical protein